MPAGLQARLRCMRGHTVSVTPPRSEPPLTAATLSVHHQHHRRQPDTPLSDHHLADIRVHRPTCFGGPHQQGANAFSTAQTQPVSAAVAHLKTPFFPSVFFDATGE
ncbi:hypothetical protein VDG41_12840 [Xanthomonas campestris pv. raphani]|nr:hypothetical protein [Xanthomonas campestris pv. raphani]